MKAEQEIQPWLPPQRKAVTEMQLAKLAGIDVRNLRRYVRELRAMLAENGGARG